MNDKFSCPDAIGGRCLMLSDIDARVSSGEIEEIYKKTRCSGKKCNKDGDQKPVLASRGGLKAKLSKEEVPGQYLEGDDLYVK
jgi:hypothetical protein